MDGGWKSKLVAAFVCATTVGAIYAGEKQAVKPYIQPSNWFSVPADPHVRAGHPQEISRFATQPRCGPYGGYYVGGGAPEGKGDGPYWPADGSFGWDYFGKYYQRRIALGWWHQDARQEPGTYKTDGPKILHKE